MKNPMALVDKVVVVTGAAQGVGRAVAEPALELGASVCAVDLNAEGLRTLAEGSDKVLPLVGGVSDPAFVQACVQTSLARFGRIDGLVNCAGNIRLAMIEKMTLEQWNSVLEVHLTGAFLWLQAVGSHMLERSKQGDDRGGAIVNISSDAGRVGSIGQINYSTAKSGMFGMTMSASREWAKFGLRTNTVCLGVVETQMTEVIRSERFRHDLLAKIPAGRFAQTHEVAPIICFLLSDAGAYVVGQHISIDGGYFMSP